MQKKTVRRSLSMTPHKREAIRRYLDEQEDLAGSRKHFERSFRERIDQLEAVVTFQLNVLIYLLTTDESCA